MWLKRIIMLPRRTSRARADLLADLLGPAPHGAVCAAAVCAPAGLVALIDLLALGSIIFSLRRFWQLRHPRRWEYLMFSLAILLVIALFLWDDFRRLSMPV